VTVVGVFRIKIWRWFLKLLYLCCIFFLILSPNFFYLLGITSSIFPSLEIICAYYYLNRVGSSYLRVSVISFFIDIIYRFPLGTHYTAFLIAENFALLLRSKMGTLNSSILDYIIFCWFIFIVFVLRYLVYILFIGRDLIWSSLFLNYLTTASCYPIFGLFDKLSVKFITRKC
jgi:hypothetical protein